MFSYIIPRSPLFIITVELKPRPDFSLPLIKSSTTPLPSLLSLNANNKQQDKVAATSLPLIASTSNPSVQTANPFPPQIGIPRPLPPSQSLNVSSAPIRIQESQRKPIVELSHQILVRPINVKSFEDSIQQLQPKEQIMAWKRFGLDIGLSLDAVPDNEVITHIKLSVANVTFLFKDYLEERIYKAQIKIEQRSVLLSNFISSTDEAFLEDGKFLLKEIKPLSPPLSPWKNLSIKSDLYLELAIKLDAWLASNTRRYIHYFRNGCNLSYANDKRGEHEILPPILTQLNLKRLSICRQKIKFLPSEILQKQMRVLDFSGNNLTELPQDFGNSIEYLKELRLNNNFISKLPESLYQKIKMGKINNFFIQNNLLNNLEKGKLTEAFEMAQKLNPNIHFHYKF